MNTLALVTMLVAATPQAGSVVLRTALHIHTTFSDGSHTVDEIARRARDKDIDAVLLGDHFLSQVEYGPPFFRKALAVSVGSPSLRPRDLERYWEASRRAERESGVLVLPGLEITPFYFWEGSLLHGNLMLNSAHRHLLVFFPDDTEMAEVARTLSQMSAPGVREFRAGSLLLVWPFLTALWAVHRLRRHRGRSFPHPLLPWLVAVLSVFALIRSWPYRTPRYSPYLGDAGTAPYQDALDLSHSMSALTFWAHPETSSVYRHPRLPVGYRSHEYPELIAATRSATGFASLYEGDSRAAVPGGSWDQALHEFVRGERLTPTWTVGELDLHREGEAGGKFLGEVETVVIATQRTHQSVLEALARGSMYAVRQPEGTRLSLERFDATCSGHEVSMGEQTSRGGPCRIGARLSAEGEPLDAVTVSLLRNGGVLSTRDVDIDADGVELQWHDEAGPMPLAYRLVVRRGNRVALYTNPVFIGVGDTAP